jgi:hypothetical protein
MRKSISTLLIIAALGGSTATASNLAAPCTMYMMQLNENQLNSLFTKASAVWAISVNALWEDYNDGLLTVTPQGGHYYRLVHVDGGSIVVLLEDNA